MANKAFDRILKEVAKGEPGAARKAREMIKGMPGDEKTSASGHLATAVAAAAAKGGEKPAGTGTGLGKGVKGAQQLAWDALSKNMQVTLGRYDKFSSRIQTISGVTSKGSGQIIKELQRMQTEHVSMGMTMQNTMDAAATAITEYAGAVTPAFKKDRMEVTRTIAVYQKLGIGLGTSVKMMNTFSAVLGKSRTEVGKTGQILNKFAKTTGQSYSKVWQEFNTNVGSFMDILDSKDMTRQTLLFQTRARRMGLSVNDMMGNLQQFETLDGAQQAAGKINAIMGTLGGSFDAVKAASMDYPERMEYMAKSIQSVMGRIEQSGPRASRAYMKAMGDAFGMDSRSLRAMISYKPGAALPAELKATGGMLGAMTSAQTATAAKEAATISTRLEAMKDLQEHIALETIPNMGRKTAIEVVNAIKMSAGRIDEAIGMAARKAALKGGQAFADKALEVFKGGVKKSDIASVNAAYKSMAEFQKRHIGKT